MKQTSGYGLQLLKIVCICCGKCIPLMYKMYFYLFVQEFDLTINQTEYVADWLLSIVSCLCFSGVATKVSWL